MKALIRKWIILTFALVLTVSTLAACASNSNGGSGGSESNGSQSGSTGQSDGDKKEPKEKVEITFWHVWSEKDSGPIEARVKAFNQMQDNIVVKVIGNQDATKQLTAISGGNPPDIALTFWPNIGTWGSAGAILPLDDYFARDGYDPSIFLPAALERTQINGKNYALPFTMSMASTLMYNKKAFEDAGITEPPKTTEELLEYARILTKRDANGEITQIGFIPDYPWIDNVFWPVIFGGSWYNEASGDVTPNLPENVRSIAYQRQFYEEFGIDQIQKFRSGMGQRGTPNDPLLTGQLAMMIGWEYNFKKERTDNGPIGIAPFPYPADRPDLEGSGMVGPRSVFIPKNAKNPDEAWEFMKYLLSKDSQVEFAIDAGVIPTVREALDDPRLTENAEMKVMWSYYEAAKSANLQGFPNSVYINEYLQALSEETEKALKGELTPQEAMDRVKEKIQPLADKANGK